jgi:hypothetical protein
MTRLFIPPLGSKLRLLKPLVLDIQLLPNVFENRGAGHAIAYPGEPYDWERAMQTQQVTLEEGTVLNFKRYFISSHAKTNDIAVSIWAHPDPRLCPKAQGGRAPRALDLVLTTQVINQIEYEVLNV